MRLSTPELEVNVLKILYILGSTIFSFHFLQFSAFLSETMFHLFSILIVSFGLSQSANITQNLRFPDFQLHFLETKFTVTAQ